MEYAIWYHDGGRDHIGRVTGDRPMAAVATVRVLRSLGSPRYAGARVVARQAGEPWRDWPSGRSWWVWWAGWRAPR